MVDSGDGARHTELGLAKQRNDKVRLVVARSGDRHVTGIDPGFLEGRELAGVRQQPLHRRQRLGLDRVRIPVDEQDVVAVLHQLGGNRATYIASPGDGHPHPSLSLRRLAERGLDLRELSVGNGRVGQVAVLKDGAVPGNHACAKAEEEGNPSTGCGLDLLDGPPDPGAVDMNLHQPDRSDRKSTRLNSSHTVSSYAVFCLKKKKRERWQIGTNREENERREKKREKRR